ncbi:MAG: AraC-like DNA-binding protein [Bermanella sp.]|jgi:AraC-like DNA-binding protein
MKDNDFYVTGIALSQFVYGAKALGIAAEEALGQAGLNDEHLLPTARVPEAQYEMTLLRLILASKSDSFGAEIGQQLMPPLYGVLISLAFSSATLGEALENMSRYQGLACGNCGGIDYLVAGSTVKLSVTITHKNPVVRRNMAEFVVTLYCCLLRLISAKPELSPDQIWLEHAPCSEAARRHLESIVGCPVCWNAGHTRLDISRDIHEMPIYGHGEENLRLAKQLAQQQLEELNERASSVESIKWHARELMLSGAPRRDVVAGRLGISTRTLDRRLQSAGIGWQELLDGLRVQLAIEYLADQELTVTQIAQKLGFTEIRAFQRRFKTWTGMTPSTYRKQRI